MNITGETAVIMWTILRVTFTFEEYAVYYGQTEDSLSMMSEVLYGLDLSAVNVTYKVTLSGLQPLSIYYYRVVSSNSITESSSAILNFTTVRDGKMFCFIFVSS